MKTRKWPVICLAILTLCMGSCQDWGQMDPIPGHQVLPKLELVANLTFDDEELNPEEIQTSPTLMATFLLYLLMKRSDKYSNLKEVMHVFLIL